MKNLLLVLISVFVISSVTAQPMNKATYTTMLSTAEEQEEAFEYYNALDWYSKAYGERKDKDVALKIAELNFMLRDYKKAERWYYRLLRKDKENKYQEARFNYARALKMQGNYIDAIDAFNEYIQTGKDEQKIARAKIELAGAKMAQKAKEVDNLTITNAGKKVNTKNAEYSPAYGPDGALYYGSFSNNKIIVMDKKAENFQVRIFKSVKGDKGWSKGEELDELINRPGYHTANVAFSPTGDRMFFTRTTLEGLKIGESKIYVSKRSGESWGPANEVTGVNGDYIAKHPAVGELFGKEVLFFVSDMEGGFGGDDIYYATLQSDGSYSTPVNLGSKINTPYSEETPFYFDGTLYFSTDGRPTFGGLDIFSSTWDGSVWSDPVNMGKGFNSPVDDLYFTLDKEGAKGFLVSNREGTRSVKSKTCCDDIWNVNLKKITADLVAEAMSETDPLAGVTVQLVEMTEDTEGKTAKKTSTHDNIFNFPLELDKSYMIIGTHPDYFPDTMYFNTVGLMDTKSFAKTLVLKPKPKYITITKEKPIELQNIYYDFDDDKILPDAEADLGVILELMNKYPDMVIELGSHTDAQGKDAYNQALSKRRAESARRWLTQRGIARNRIRAVGYGETQIRNHCVNGVDCTDEEHRYNRRTEFKILEGPTSIKLEETKLVKIGSKVVSEEEKNKNKPLVISMWSSLYGKKDLKGMPIMDFDRRFFDLGKIKRGSQYDLTYKFTNRGDVPLEIEIVTSCDCTTLEYPRKPVKPGQSSAIKAHFDSKDKVEDETIIIDIILKNKEKGTDVPIVEQLKYRFLLD